MLLEDPWLAGKVDLAFLNTTPNRDKHPGAADLGNLRDAVGHARAVFTRGRRVDVIHLHASPAPVLPLLRASLLTLAARAAGARVIVHAHTGRLHTAAASPLYRLILRMLLGLVDAFVVVSRDAERAIGGLGSNVIRLENAVDTDRLTPGTKAPELVFVGTVCERKGLIDLRDALVRSGLGRSGDTRLRVRIVGDGVQEGPGAFERVVSAYQAEGLSGVVFEGALEPPTVADIISTAAMFCLPSHWEGLPLSLLEAMASGCAVIATAVGDVPFVLDHGAAGVLVPPHDPAALSSALDRLMADPAETARLGSEARRRVESEFGRGRLVRQVFELYAAVAAKRRRR